MLIYIVIYPTIKGQFYEHLPMRLLSMFSVSIKDGDANETDFLTYVMTVYPK